MCDRCSIRAHEIQRAGMLAIREEINRPYHEGGGTTLPIMLVAIAELKEVLIRSASLTFGEPLDKVREAYGHVENAAKHYADEAMQGGSYVMIDPSDSADIAKKKAEGAG